MTRKLNSDSGDSKLNSDSGDSELLQEYRRAIPSFLRRVGFHNCAEDVASEMVADQWARMRAGSLFRPHGVTLPKVLRREAFRKAKRASSLKLIGESELEEIRSPDGSEDEGILYRELMTSLENVFKKSQITGMIGAVAAGMNRLRDLAVAAGISERTFRARLRGMGVKPRR